VAKIEESNQKLSEIILLHVNAIENLLLQKQLNKQQVKGVGLGKKYRKKIKN